MFYDEFARDPETKASAGIFFCGEEGLEDAVQILGRDAKAGIRDGDANAGSRGIARIDGGVGFDADGSSPGAGVEAVGEQVGEDLAKLSGRAQHLSARCWH